MGKSKTKKTKKEKNKPFEKMQNSFIDNIETVSFLIPVLMETVLREFKKFRVIFGKFLTKNARRLKNKKYAIRVEASEKYEELLRKRRQIDLSKDTIPRSLFISLVCYLDNHFKEILKIIFNKNPNLLSGTEKNISLSELFELHNFTEAKRYVLEREMSQILESRLKFFNWLENNLGLKFNFDPALLGRLIELTERRNLFVHADGVVDKKYIDICKKYNVKFDKYPKIGEKLTLNPRYFWESFMVIYILGVQLTQIVWRNLFPEELKISDINLINITGDLMNRNKNLISFELSNFASGLKVFSEEFKLMFLVNKALALKFLKRQNEAEKVLNSYDWSASEDKFKLAVAIIKDEEKRATEIMTQIGQTLEMKQAYDDWPLFKEFGKKRIFSDTYRKIFGVSYSERDIPSKLSIPKLSLSKKNTLDGGVLVKQLKKHQISS